MQTDVLIIGAGLAGLALADHLHRDARDHILVEARPRIGGRIQTQHVGTGYFDLGPTWFWDGQPRIAALITRLGLERFDQHYQGDLMFEDERGQVQRGRGISSMQGSYRLKGGLGALTQALAANLPDVRLNSGVTALTQTDAGVIATVADGSQITARHVVLAIPPRVAAQTITFSPALPTATMDTMNGIATWMAGQAKAVAVYDEAFWMDARLSGDASSRRGPMVEIHDASPAQGGPFALFGFIGVPPQARQDEAGLRAELIAQLERLFGPKAASPVDLLVKDWAFDPETATQADQAPLYAHPQYGLPDEMAGLWDGALLFGGTEVAPEFGGYLEGALEAASNAV